MVLGMGMRTIWISLRALNYTDRAFRAAIKNLDELTKEERKNVKAALKMHQVGRMNIQVGMLGAATLSMVAGRLAGFLSLTETGSEYMEQFNQTLQQVKTAFADTFFETLKPILSIVKGFFKILADNAPLRQAVVYLTLAAMALMALYSAHKLMIGIYQWTISLLRLKNWLRKKGLILKFKTTMANLGLTASNHALAVSLLWVAAAAGAAFGLFFALRGVIGDLPAALIALAAVFAILAIKMWLAASALSVLTFGVAAVAGGLAIAGALAAMGGIKSFGMGTRALPYTGLFRGHKGEVVYNPATGRPTGVGKELEERRPTTSIQDVDITIENVHTKADIDDFNEKISRRLRDASREA